MGRRPLTPSRAREGNRALRRIASTRPGLPEPPPTRPGSTPAECQSALEAWLLRCDALALSDVTISHRRYLIGRLVAYLTASGQNLTLESLQAYINSLRDPLPGATRATGRGGATKNTSVNNHFRAIRTFLNYAREEDLLPALDLSKLHVPQPENDQPIPLTPAQVLALEKAAERTQYPKRNRAIVALLVSSGIRLGEVVDLRFSDIDIPSRRAIIRDAKMGKSREVFFGANAAAALSAYLKLEPRYDDDPLFFGEKGIPAGDGSGGLKESGIGKMVRLLGRDANLPAGLRCSPHTLRHTFAIEALRAGWDLMSVSRQLGHESVEQTQQYLKIASADIAAMSASRDPLDRMKQDRKRRR